MAAESDSASPACWNARMSDDQRFEDAVRESAAAVAANFAHHRLAIGHVRGFCPKLVHS